MAGRTAISVPDHPPRQSVWEDARKVDENFERRSQVEGGMELVELGQSDNPPWAEADRGGPALALRSVRSRDRVFKPSENRQ